MAYKFTYKGIDKVAEVYRTLALTLIRGGYSGWKKAPYKTGNLYNKVADYNTAARMATYRTTRSSKKIELPQVTISLNYAPGGAQYGKFVEEGTSKMEARPFAKIASEDPALKRAVDEVLSGNDGPVNAYLKVVMSDLDKVWKKAGFVKV